MNYVYVPKMIHSTKKDKDYFFICLELRNEKGTTIASSDPIIWLKEEDYKKLLNIQK